jgi:hypothetical protein
MKRATAANGDSPSRAVIARVRPPWRKLILMRTVRVLYLTFATTAIFAAQTARAQDSHPALFHFHKTGDTLSIPNATVTIDHIIEIGKTDAHGLVRAPEIEDGGHIIEATAPGYEYIFDQFDSGPNVKQPIEIEMGADKRQANVVKGVPTDLRFADFNSRLAKGVGTFFTRAQLDAAAGRPIANLLRVNGGASLVRERGGEVLVASGAQPDAAPCYAAVVRDGTRIYPATGATPPDLDKLFAEDFSGIELYRQASMVPAELKDAAMCGAIVLWSRSANK